MLCVFPFFRKYEPLSTDWIVIPIHLLTRKSPPLFAGATTEVPDEGSDDAAPSRHRCLRARSPQPATARAEARHRSHERSGRCGCRWRCCICPSFQLVATVRPGAPESRGSRGGKRQLPGQIFASALPPRRDDEPYRPVHQRGDGSPDFAGCRNRGSYCEFLLPIIMSGITRGGQVIDHARRCRRSTSRGPARGDLHRQVRLRLRRRPLKSLPRTPLISEPPANCWNPRAQPPRNS